MLALSNTLRAAMDSLAANFIGGEGRGEVALRFMGRWRSAPPKGGATVMRVLCPQKELLTSMVDLLSSSTLYWNLK